MRKHWYFITIFYCPQCGSEKIYRDRRYGYRPKKYANRHKEVEAYDWCDRLISSHL